MPSKYFTEATVLPLNCGLVRLTQAPKMVFSSLLSPVPSHALPVVLWFSGEHGCLSQNYLQVKPHHQGTEFHLKETAHQGACHVTLHSKAPPVFLFC